MPRNALLLTLLALGFACPASAQTEPPTIVIVGAQIADGAGAPLRKASVRIVGDRITRIGKFKPAKNDRVIDGKGLVLAPGFIDIHNHSDEGLEAHPLAETQISQGITTVILGPDGGSPWPIGEWLEKRRQNPAALNLAVLVGHATVRKQVMGDDYKRDATPAEIEKMAALVDQAMREGAIGLSSGLEYEVGSYSATDELVALARAAAKHSGFYMTHIRDEADKAFDALNEEISIGERARIPVEHSHIKLGTVGVLGKAAGYIKIIEDARRRGVDFLADCYPYDAWHSNLKVLVPNKQYEDPRSVEKALADVGGASRVTITDFPPHPDYEGKTIEALARDRGISPVEMYIQLIREGDGARTEAGVIGQSMIEPDIKAFYQQPWVMVASDGGIGMKHPRGAGTFPRVLGRFVREKHWLTLPEAIRKMTSLPARRLGWKDRGVLREGAVADLVLFNPRTVIDRSTFEQPFELPVGIEKVFVNGELVWSDSKPTGARPGRVLPGGQSAQLPPASRMKTLGLIGGTSWYSTIEYYRYINKTINDAYGNNTNPPLLLYNLNQRRIHELQAKNQWDDIAAVLIEAAMRLRAGGAQAILFCANTPHKVYAQVARKTEIPILHIADATGVAIRGSGLKKVGLIGTLYTMEDGFIADWLKEHYGIDTLVPNSAPARQELHRIVQKELGMGIFKAESKKYVLQQIEELRQRGAQGIVLGSTEFPLIIKSSDVEVPLFDTTLLHSQMAVDFILGEQGLAHVRTVQ